MPNVFCFARRIYPIALLLPAGPVLAQAPIITEQSPLANSNAAATSPVIIRFNQPMIPGSETALKVFSSQRGGLRTQSSPSVVNDSTIQFMPTYPFMPGETVLSTVTTAAGSSGGLLGQPRVSQFTVAVGGTGRGGFIAPAINAELAVGASPSGLVLGDVDGDGDLDLLSSSYFNATVSLRLNNGQGNFTVPATNPEITVGATPAGVVLGDVDGDGDLDLLAGNMNGSSVSVRLNNGSGVFSGGSDPGVGDYPSSLAVGDLDGDGDLDLVVTNFNNATVSIRLNDGTGNFTAAAAAPTVAVGNRPNSIALGDVDGDGDLDLATANDDSGTVSVRFNDGAGYFSASAAPDMDMGNYPQAVVLGDVDGDGDLDLASTDLSSNVVRVRFNDGMGGFTARAATPDVAAGSSPKAIVLGDVDADGDLDLLVVGSIGTVSVRLNNGSGSFSAPASNGTVAVGSASGSIIGGDIDGDGDLDFLTTNALSKTVSVRLNGGTVLASSPRRELAGLAAFFPNPAHATAMAQLPAISGATEATLALRDALGRVVRTQRLHLNATGTTAELALTGLAPGLYQVQVQAGGQCLNGRLAVE